MVVDTNKTPFNLYDFYGYIFPGTLLLISSAAIINYFNNNLGDTFNVVMEFSNKLQFISGFMFILSLVAIVYFVGHLNATLSHLLVDRIFVKIIVGYPIYTLLGINFKERHFSRATNFYFLLILNLMLFTPVIKFLFPSFVHIEGCISFYIIAFLLLIFSRILILFFEKRFFPLDVVKPSIEEVTKNEKAIKFLHKVYCFIFNLFDNYIFKIINILISCDSNFHRTIQSQFKEKLKKDFNLDADLIGTDNYWLPLTQLIEKSPGAYKNINNWLNLYGFLKNLSMVSMILCFEVSLFLTLSYFQIVNHKAGNLDIILFCGFYFSSILLVIRFWIIYRSYYTKYIIRCYVALELKK